MKIVEKNNSILIIVLCCLALSLLGNCIQEYRLGVYRQQLESTRMELAAATNRQSEIAEILRRDGQILNESFTTISGIRSQIAIIKENYETMENILSGNNNSSDK